MVLKFRQLIASCLLLLCSMASWSAPAYPGKIVYRQPDGTRLAVYLRGDEHFHFYESEDGLALLPDAGRALRYAVPDAAGRVSAAGMVAHNVDMRGMKERTFVKTLDRSAIRRSLAGEVKMKKEHAMRRVMPGEIKKTFPTTGEIRGIIILAQFTDRKFSRDDIRDVYDRMANDENYSGPYSSGSIRNYFKTQSDGKFVPTFDVVGPVDLPHDMAYYGYDEKAAELMIDACNAADVTAGADFSKYDYNGDGYVDFVFVVYAGYGQAQGGNEETVWPQAVDLTYESWNMYDGLYLSQAACSCELKGYEGDDIDGIGTFCHEFSHILGLPDIYDPVYSGMTGMLNWDVMDLGLYNDDSRTPAGYTAMDKFTVGWLEPVVLDAPAEGLALRPLSECNEAYFIVCGTDNNEYYTLENRQQTGWDKGLDGHGLIISHIHYIPSLWAGNRVNTTSSGYAHVSLVPADNMASDDTKAGDPFPGTGGNTSFTDSSSPSAFWHTSTENVGCPVTNIREVDGVITFDFKKETVGISSAGVSEPFVSIEGGTVCVDNPFNERVQIVAADGRVMCTSSESRVVVSPGSGMYMVRRGPATYKFVVR